MASQSWEHDSSVTESVESRLWKEPYHFDFFQAVYLLGRIQASRKMVGGSARPSEEIAHFSANPSVVFPSSDIQSLDSAVGGLPPRMAVNFLGLTGPQGVLPLLYTKAVMERTRAGDNGLRDFLDIFNHRILSLYYRAWVRYHFAKAPERDVRRDFSQYLMSLIGSADDTTVHEDISAESLLFYAGLLAQQPRSLNALHKILADYFRAPVEIEQFIGSWYDVDEGTQCLLGEGNNDLGGRTVVGDRFWDLHGGIRIRLGPLCLEEYRGFLPTGSSYGALRGITRIFSRGQLDFEVELVLREEDVPSCELKSEDSDEQPLGWLTCIKIKPSTTDGPSVSARSAYGTVLRL